MKKQSDTHVVRREVAVVARGGLCSTRTPHEVHRAWLTLDMVPTIMLRCA
jgi:hypothetical protein